MKDTFENIRSWATEKEIFDKSNFNKQALYLDSEKGELADAIMANDLPEIIDAIGDCMVVATNMAHFEGIKIESFISLNLFAFAEKSFLKNIPIEKLHIQFSFQCAKLMQEGSNYKGFLLTLIHICIYYDLDLLGCVRSAYKVISQRTGKMQNGVFVKDK